MAIYRTLIQPSVYQTINTFNRIARAREHTNLNERVQGNVLTDISYKEHIAVTPTTAQTVHFRLVLHTHHLRLASHFIETE